ncbi:sugar O-acetyltransferase [Microtetraspora niveoalba]|uniref:sugar O-acetyltransferase n=1 Tax=Microtetraspora niveoalba TaxID=46175 RepID=UPI000834AB1D|nr:sugar O-acetyltransferase [Microtetraspora niveoalba]
MATAKEKMLAGELYIADDPQLNSERLEAALIVEKYNSSSAADPGLRRLLLEELCDSVGHSVEVRPPFSCVYGKRISLGDRVFVNFGCVFLDMSYIDIGNGAWVGPGVQLLTGTHPLDPQLRKAGYEYGQKITVGADAWLGGGVIVMPGITIGDGAVIGAGSVVTKDVPPGVLAYGNPARVVRTLP